MAKGLLVDASKVLDARAKWYPPFYKEAAKVCAVVNAVLGLNITPKQYAIILICMKLCREGVNGRRDNRLDLVGYITLLDEIHAKPLARKNH